MQDKKMNFNELNQSWWIKTMEYIRTVPGKVYEDQLLKLISTYGKQNLKEELKATRLDIAEYLNSKAPTDKKEKFLIMDPMTKGVYTIPSQRSILDQMIKAENPFYDYNSNLYVDDSTDKVYKSISFKGLKKKYPVLFNKVFLLNRETGRLIIDFSPIGDTEINAYESFNLSQIVGYFRDEVKKQGNSEVFQVGRINCNNLCFVGDVDLSLNLDEVGCCLLDDVCFSGATILGDFRMEGVNLNFSDNYGGITPNIRKLDFRNCRFFGGVLMRDIYLWTEGADVEISFEDARIQNNFEMVNVCLGKARLNCFQMIVGNFVSYVDRENMVGKERHNVKLLNIDIHEDSIMDFSDVEADNTDFVFSNFEALPETKVSFAPRITYINGKSSEQECPDIHLQIRNCEIRKVLYIGNVSELSFYDSTNNGRIMEAKNWGKFPVEKEYRLSSRGVVGTAITNPLLSAVYNNMDFFDFENGRFLLNYSKAKDFIMLKENFCSNGKYDEEDEAFILFMEFKPYIDGFRLNNKKSKNLLKKDSKKNFLYKCLYATGKYGISPGRVVVALFTLIISCSLLYYVTLLLHGAESINLNYTLGWILKDMKAPLGKGYLFVSCVLYSIANVIPFTTQFEPVNIQVCIISIIENAIGSFLVGYFSVAVVRKTLR